MSNLKFNPTTGQLDLIGNSTLTGQTKVIFQDAQNMYTSAGTSPTASAAVSILLDSVSLIRGWSFAGTSVNTNAGWSFMVPKDYASGGKFKVVYSPATTEASLTFVFSMKFACRAVGDSVLGIDETITNQTLPLGTASIYRNSDWFTPTTVMSADDMVSINLVRLTADAGDTYTGTVNVLGVLFEYTT